MLGGVKSLFSWKAHIFLNILISNTHLSKIWSYVFVSLNPLKWSQSSLPLKLSTFLMTKSRASISPMSSLRLPSFRLFFFRSLFLLFLPARLHREKRIRMNATILIDHIILVPLIIMHKLAEIPYPQAWSYLLIGFRFNVNSTYIK